MWWAVYTAGQKQQNVGYVTDPQEAPRRRTAEHFGGELIGAKLPDGYCIVADGADIIAARTNYSIVARYTDPVPKIEERKAVYKRMWECDIIEGIDYFCRCDNDYRDRWLAIDKAIKAIWADYGKAAD